MGSARLRALGVLTLLAVLVLAVAVAQPIAPPLGGTAAAVPVAGPPQVGDCVATDPFTGRSAVTTLATARFAPCTQPHAGEVVGVTADRDDFPTMIMDQLSVPDPRGCAGAAADRLGLADAARDGRPWRLREVTPVDLIGPDARQQAPGQRWVACVGYLPNGAITASLPDLFAGGQLPPSFGSCSSDLGGSCGSDHREQVFADLDLTYTVPAQALLDARCRQLVQAVTRMPDPTAGRRLELVSSVVFYDRAGYPHPGYPTAGEPASAACALRVAGPGVLTSTLLGLGARPLPLVG